MKAAIETVTAVSKARLHTQAIRSHAIVGQVVERPGYSSSASCSATSSETLMVL